MLAVCCSECLDGLDLHSNGFELACKRGRQGNLLFEAPVTAIAQRFEGNKKTRFWRDAVRSYFALYRYPLTK